MQLDELLARKTHEAEEVDKIAFPEKHEEAERRRAQRQRERLLRRLKHERRRRRREAQLRVRRGRGGHTGEGKGAGCGGTEGHGWWVATGGIRARRRSTVRRAGRERGTRRTGRRW